MGYKIYTMGYIVCKWDTKARKWDTVKTVLLNMHRRGRQVQASGEHRAEWAGRAGSESSPQPARGPLCLWDPVTTTSCSGGRESRTEGAGARRWVKGPELTPEPTDSPQSCLCSGASAHESQNPLSRR